MTTLHEAAQAVFDRCTAESVNVLAAFDVYARQFTHRNHPAEPKHFPLSYPWFEAGFLAALERERAKTNAEREAMQSEVESLRVLLNYEYQRKLNGGTK